MESIYTIKAETKHLRRALAHVCPTCAAKRGEWCYTRRVGNTVEAAGVCFERLNLRAMLRAHGAK